MISPAQRSQLAPTGALRVAIMYSNPVTAARDARTGKLGGIAVDLARELARYAGAPLQLIGYETTASMLRDTCKDRWDAAFTAISTGHADHLEFTAPYLETEGTFLVPPGSPLKQIADVDREGVRIAVSEQSSLDQYLTKTLQHAQLVRIPGAPAAFELLASGRADALAGLRQQLAKAAPDLIGSRVFDGRFMVIQQGIAIAKQRRAGAQCLRAFIEHVKACGLVLRLVESNKLAGVIVPAAISAAS